MSTQAALLERSESKCELCAAMDGLSVYDVTPNADGSSDTSVLLCSACQQQIDGADDNLDINHWRCLTDSMWTQIPAVQVMAWRMLNRLRAESWARDALDMLYLEDDVLAWAEAGVPLSDNADSQILHKDCNGTLLEAGDTVTLIKDLKVKGGGFTAKRGTAVRGISLVSDDPKHIEGRVSGQQIVIVAEYVKKS